MKKFYALLLVVVMLAASLVACNDNNTNSEPADQSKGNEQARLSANPKIPVAGCPKRNGIPLLSGLPIRIKQTPVLILTHGKSGAKKKLKVTA